MRMSDEWMEKYHNEIDKFAQETKEFHEHDLSRKDYKGISGGFGSYAQRDDQEHMVRLRLTGGKLDRENLEFLANLVDRYNIKRLKMSTCETIQLHDLSYDQVAPIIWEAADHGIYTKPGGGANPRNVMVSPLSGVQEGEAFDVNPYADAVAEYTLSVCHDFKMPRKLKIAFSNGVDDSVHATFRDMGFIANPDGTFKLYICGGLGNDHKMGVLMEENLDPKEILYYVRGMIDFFCQFGNYKNRAKARTRFLQETMEPEKLKEEYFRIVDGLKAKGGLDLYKVEEKNIDKQGEGTIVSARVLPQKQKELFSVEYHPIGGVLPTEMPRKMLELLEKMPGVEIRIGADETLWFINCTAKEAAEILELSKESANTPFEHSVACIGAAVCQQGLRNSQSILRDCIFKVREHPEISEVLPKVRISGCASSCAAHQVGSLGFQGFVKVVEKIPQAAFRVFVGGSDEKDNVRFGEFVGVVLEKDMPDLFLALGKACLESQKTWDAFVQENRDDVVSIIESFA